jgi:hypothetical protein
MKATITILFLFISVSIYSQIDTVYLKINKTPIETEKELNESVLLIREHLKTNELFIKTGLNGYEIYCKAVVPADKKRVKKSQIKFI